MGSESSIVRGIGSIQGPLRCLGVGGRFAKELSQLTAAKEVAEDYLHPNSQVISDRIPRVGVRAGGVSSVRATGLSAPTSILSTAGPVLGRGYALRIWYYFEFCAALLDLYVSVVSCPVS